MVNTSPDRFTPGKDPLPIVQEAGWAPGPAWTGGENLARAHNTVYIDTIFHLPVRTTSAKLVVIVRPPLGLLSCCCLCFPPNLRLKFHGSRHLTVPKTSDVRYKLFTYLFPPLSKIC